MMVLLTCGHQLGAQGIPLDVFYWHAFSGVDAHPVYKMLWKSSCMPWVKNFAWLVLVDRLNTKTMLRRRHLNIQDDVLCVMCNTGMEEDIEHLFFDCPFAGQCWSSINFAWDSSLPLTESFSQKPPLLQHGNFGSSATTRFFTGELLILLFG